MANYKYRAKENNGNTVEGVLQAASEQEALDQVAQLGYLPMRIEEVAAAVRQSETVQKKASPTAPTENRPAKISSSGGIGSKEITAFGRQLSSLIRAGVPILNAIGTIADQSENLKFRALLLEMHSEIKNGAPFSIALSKYPNLFSPLYLALISAGESSGTLDQTLASITDYRQKQEEIVSRVRSAMVYPILMALVGTGTIIFMMTFVMPRLMGIFANLGGNLPLPTRLLIQISNTLRSPWSLSFIVVVGILGVIQLRKKGNRESISLSKFMLQIPIFGTFTLKAQMARFSRTLELLIKSGVPIIRAIENAKPVIDNALLKKELDSCLQNLREGGSFGKALRQSKQFPVFMTNLIIVGEESGHLDEVLAEISAFYERETDEAIRMMTSLLEPLMIIVMGLVVGFIVIAMLLPMFELNMMVK